MTSSEENGLVELIRRMSLSGQSSTHQTINELAEWLCAHRRLLDTPTLGRHSLSNYAVIIQNPLGR